MVGARSYTHSNTRLIVFNLPTLKDVHQLAFNTEIRWSPLNTDRSFGSPEASCQEQSIMFQGQTGAASTVREWTDFRDKKVYSGFPFAQWKMGTAPVICIQPPR